MQYMMCKHLSKCNYLVQNTVSTSTVPLILCYEQSSVFQIILKYFFPKKETS